MREARLPTARETAPMDGHDHPQQRHPSRDPSQASQLVALTTDVELFHTPKQEAYATLWVNGHREMWPVESDTFRTFLERCFYEKTRNEGHPAPVLNNSS